MPSPFLVPFSIITKMHGGSVEQILLPWMLESMFSFYGVVNEAHSVGGGDQAGFDLNFALFLAMSFVSHSMSHNGDPGKNIRKCEKSYRKLQHPRPYEQSQALRSWNRGLSVAVIIPYTQPHA